MGEGDRKLEDSLPTHLIPRPLAISFLSQYLFGPSSRGKTLPTGAFSQAVTCVAGGILLTSSVFSVLPVAIGPSLCIGSAPALQINSALPGTFKFVIFVNKISLFSFKTTFPYDESL